LVAEDLKLPTSKYAFVSSEQELFNAAESITGYPCFVKPTMSSSGKGQSMVKNRNELAAAWEYAQQGGRTNTGTVIVESKINFDYEITLLTVRSMDKDDNIKIDCCQPIGHRQENGDYRESWQPHPMSDLATAKAQYIAKTVVENLGGFGVFGVELFVKGDNVWFSEVSPRPHDTGMVTMVTQHQSEFDLHVRAILGLPVDVSAHSCGASSVILSNVESDNIEYNGLCQALNIPNSEVRIFGKPSATINRRMGVALTRAENITLAKERAIQCSNLIDISEY
jgi:phosphoribosylglycinamide formyltransferase 2